MPSTVKRTGRVGTLLASMAERGGTMTSDHRGFPPAHVFLPLRRRGLVVLDRIPTLGGRCRYSRWSLTDRGWRTIGLAPPVPES